MPKPIHGSIPKLPVGEIRWLTGNMHVSESTLAVARAIRKRTASKRARKVWSWEARRAAMRFAIRCHQQNRQLYADVMSGHFAGLMV